MSKYHSQKVTVNGIVFDSKKEARRYHELLLLERAGEIRNLVRQKRYILIPTQREESKEVYSRGVHKGEKKQGKVIEKECSYIADFSYDDKKGNHVVEDCKGMKTEVYKIKRKLMLYKYGIRIKES